jgi:hypothetical protein
MSFDEFDELGRHRDHPASGRRLRRTEQHPAAREFDCLFLDRDSSMQDVDPGASKAGKLAEPK